MDWKKFAKIQRDFWLVIFLSSNESIKRDFEIEDIKLKIIKKYNIEIYKERYYSRN